MNLLLYYLQDLPFKTAKDIFLYNVLRVPMVLNPHEIEPTFLKLDLWSPGVGFIPILSTKAISKIKKRKIEEKDGYKKI